MDSIEETAKSLHKAMRGLGTDEDRLIREIVSHSNAQRQLVKAKYLTLYGKVRNN
jgi:annexin A7/11